MNELLLDEGREALLNTAVAPQGLAFCQQGDDWLPSVAGMRIYHSGSCCRDELARCDDVRMVIVGDDMTDVSPINLAAALKMDRPERSVILVDRTQDPDVRFRAGEAQLDAVVDDAQVLEFLLGLGGASAAATPSASAPHIAADTSAPAAHVGAGTSVSAPSAAAGISTPAAHVGAGTSTSAPSAAVARPASAPHVDAGTSAPAATPAPTPCPSSAPRSVSVARAARDAQCSSAVARAARDVQGSSAVARAAEKGPVPRRDSLVVSVISSCGGVGKSVVSVILALLARRAGLRSALVDCDLQFGDLAFLMEGEGACCERIFFSPSEPVGYSLVSGGSHPCHPVSQGPALREPSTQVPSGQGPLQGSSAQRWVTQGAPAQGAPAQGPSPQGQTLQGFSSQGSFLQDPRDIPADRLLLVLSDQGPEQAEFLAAQIPSCLETLRSLAQFTVVNTGAFWTDMQAVLMEHSDVVLFLMDQRSSSVGSCVRARDLCTRMGIPSSKFVYVLNRCSSRNPLTSMDVAFVLGGKEIVSLADGGREVDELMGLGTPQGLLDSRNPFVASLESLLATLISTWRLPCVPSETSEGGKASSRSGVASEQGAFAIPATSRERRLWGRAGRRSQGHTGRRGRGQVEGDGAYDAPRIRGSRR